VRNSPLLACAPRLVPVGDARRHVSNVVERELDRARCLSRWRPRIDRREEATEGPADAKIRWEREIDRRVLGDELQPQL
jgi:hypothetical protein